MINKKNILTKSLLIIIFICLALTIEQVHAYTVNVEFAHTNQEEYQGIAQNGSGDFSVSCEKPGEIPDYIPEEYYSYSCNIHYEYEFKMKYDEEITINAYGMDDEPLIKTSLIPTQKNLAGTAIGIETYLY